MKRVDPSFSAVDPVEIDAHIDIARRAASENGKETFLLSAMRLFALSGNGHTRLIPNDAISVLPLRFVAIGPSVYLTAASNQFAELAPRKLLGVNGVSVKGIEKASASFLAGTPQRQRVIGPLLYAWPAALAHLGVGSVGSHTQYLLQDADASTTTIRVANADTVAASELYPRNEHGKAEPIWNHTGFVEFHHVSAHGAVLKLPSFFDPEERTFPKAIDKAAAWVDAHKDRCLVIDVRGNTGGDFLVTMPLIEAIARNTWSGGCAVVVDKFTFSAAIVFVALLKYRLGSRLTIVGEEMGDCLRFFAEGGLTELPSSGALVRYSTALHDWEAGSVDQTTPPEIARMIVPVRRLDIDRDWFSSPFDAAPQSIVYERLVKDLAHL
ncbi:MAG: peptidase S41 [Pseudomonadota bacterium]